MATDLYESSDAEGKPEMLINPEKFAPFEYRKDHLTVLKMSGTNLLFRDNIFNFAFCLSSIEHFGSRENQKKALMEIYRILKSGGILCLATELILNNAYHHEYFTIDELDEVILNATDFKLVGGDIDYRISSSLVTNPIELDKKSNLYISPHIVLKRGDVLWTSIMLFLQKM